ncbi:MAG: hypothetical protein ACK53Y_11205 [bacterium]
MLDSLSVAKLLCISSYTNLSAKSRTGSSSSLLLPLKAYLYPFQAAVTEIPMMVVTKRNQAF